MIYCEETRLEPCSVRGYLNSHSLVQQGQCSNHHRKYTVEKIENYKYQEMLHEKHLIWKKPPEVLQDGSIRTKSDRKAWRPLGHFVGRISSIYSTEFPTMVIIDKMGRIKKIKNERMNTGEKNNITLEIERGLPLTNWNNFWKFRVNQLTVKLQHNSTLCRARCILGLIFSSTRPAMCLCCS